MPHDFSFFDCSSPFCFLLIEFHYCFLISYKNITILCLLLLDFDKDVIGRRDFFFHARFASFQLTPLFLPSSSVSLSYFILAVPMSKCLRKHSCVNSHFL